MEIHHVNPSNWQPLLCMALLDDLQPLCDAERNLENVDSANIFSYFNGRRGRMILEILAIAQWKALPNASGFLGILTKAWKSMHRVFVQGKSDGESEDGINLQEFDILLASDGDNDIVHDINISTPRDCRQCVISRPNRFRNGSIRIRLKKRKDLEKLRLHVDLPASDDDQLAPDITSPNKNALQRSRRFRSPLSAGLLGLPVVQEDSDGFPACWCDDGLATITENARMNVDDIVLPMIRSALSRKLTFEDDEPAVILALLACLIRKTLPFLQSNDDTTAIWQFVAVFLSTFGAEDVHVLSKDPGITGKPRTAVASSSETVTALKRQLLVCRHGMRTLVSTLTAKKSHQYSEMLINSASFLLRNLRIICQSLSAAPLAIEYFELLRTEGCMEYLLETAADVVIGIFRLTVCLLPTNENSIENIAETLDTSINLLGLCKDGSLDEMVRDVCIGLDLLATIDFATDRLPPTVGQRSDYLPSESEKRFYLDNVYYGKLYCILFHIVASITSLQRLTSMKSHLATCSKSSHKMCCVSCQGFHHTNASEFGTSSRQQITSITTNKCAIAYLEGILLGCLRNVTGSESKQMCVEALESFTSCCCVSKLHFLTILLEELAELSTATSESSLLLNCFASKLTKHRSCGHCSGMDVSGVTDEKTSIASTHHRMGHHVAETEAFETAWKRFTEKSSSEEIEETFFRVLHRVIPFLNQQFREKVVCISVVPSLSKWCRDQDRLLKSTNDHLPTRLLFLFSLMVDLCETAIKSATGYSRVLDSLYIHADVLFDHPDTRTPFLKFVRHMAEVEWDVLGDRTLGKQHVDYVFNKFLFNKYYMVGKLILNDTQNFVSDAAWEYWLTSAVLLGTCRELLINKKPTNNFRLIFTDFGGFAHACRIIEVVAQSIAKGIEEKSGQRLARLLSETVGLCLAVGVTDEKISVAFAPLQSLVERISIGQCDRILAIVLAKRLLDEALASSGSTVQADMHVGNVQYHEPSGAEALSCFSTSDDGAQRSSKGGYEADAEIIANTTTVSSLRFTADNGRAKTRIHARLCSICLQMLSPTSIGMQQDPNDPAAIAINKLTNYCSTRPSFAKMLIEAECVDISLKLAEKAAEVGLKGSCSASIRLVFELFKCDPQKVDLKQALKLVNHHNGAFQEIIINCLAKIVDEIPFEPTSYLKFPQFNDSQRWAEESAKHLPTISRRRSRSSSPKKKAADFAKNQEVMKYERSRKTSLAAAASSGPFAPLLSGLSSFFTFGGGQGTKKKSGSKEREEHDQSTATSSGEIAIGQKPGTSGLAGVAFASWPDAAVAFLMDGNARCSISQGISIGLWIYLMRETNTTTSDEPLHLLTCGDDTLSCSTYVQRSDTSITIRLFHGGLLIAEFVRPKFLPLEKWTHVLLVISLSVEEKLVVKVFCDGIREACWRKSWQYIPGMKHAATAYVCLGASTTNGQDQCGYLMGNVAGFRGDLSLEHSIVLRAMGPRCVSITDTKSRRLEGDISSYINAPILLDHQQDLNIRILMEDRLGLIEHLQKSQAFVHTPTDTDRVFVYPVDKSVKTVLNSGNTYEEAVGQLCSKVPIPKPSAKQTTMECESKVSLDDAFAALGGVKLFLFLFARVVECEQPESCQASALKLLLKTASRNPEWWREFLDLRGYVIVSRVLSTPYCRRGYKLLEPIFDFALSVNIFRRPKTHPIESIGAAKPEIVGVGSAAIQDPYALTSFLLDPDIWKEADALTVWKFGLDIIVRLLTQTAPPVAAFNIYQLNKAKFLKYLFFALTERSQDVHIRLSSNISSTVSTIVANLIESPPNLFELTSCWDFVFLTHPASSTYLNYRIGGPSDWLDSDSFNEPSVRLDNYESKLATKLRQIMNVLGKGKFIEWITSDEALSNRLPGGVPVVVNDALAAAIAADRQGSSSSNSDDQLMPAASAEALAQQQLPDLVCDIDASTAALDMSDSMRTATQSTSATDDDFPIFDDYVDANSDVAAIGAGGRNASNSIYAAIEAPWLVETRGALLSVVFDVLANAPDPIYRRVAGSVVKWEHLLVMLRRQNDPVIRTACMRTLCLLLVRFNADQRQQFLKANGFALLANQLREHPCTPEIVDGLFSVLFGENLKIENGVDIDRLSTLSVDRFRASVVKPLLLAYQNSVEDVALFWNMSTSLCRIFQYNNALAQTMLESHLGEVLANMLLQLSLRHHSETDISGITDGSLMIEGWRSLASIVLHRCVTRSNVVHHQAFSEFLQLIACAAVTSLKFGYEAHIMVRKELCVLIQLGFESIRQLFDEGGTSAAAAGAIQLPAFISNLSSRLSTPFQSGRATPSIIGEDAFHTSWTKSYSVIDGGAKNSQSATPVAIKRHSSMSGSFTNLKDKILSISQGNVSQISTDSEKSATQSELLDRWKILVQYSVEYFIFFTADDCFEERHFFDYLIHFAVSTLANESNVRKRGNSWQSLMWSSRSKLQQFLSNILIFALYPAQKNLSKLSSIGHRGTTILDDETVGAWFRRRLLIVETLAHEPECKSVLKYVLDSTQECQSIVTTAVYELVLCDYRLQENDQGNCQKFAKLLRLLKVKAPFDEYENADEIVHNVCLDERLTLEIYIGLRTKWLERMRQFALRLRDRHQNSSQSLSDEAMSITCAVVNEQNVPRKLFIQLKKQVANDLLVAEENLRNLVIDLCHPAGSCFDVPSWPASWRLDPTEGPSRERRRLIPAHLGVEERFVLPEHRWKLNASIEKRPLTKLLSGTSPDSVAVSTIAGQLLERLRIEDKIIFNCSATVIRSSFECQGELLLGDRALYFVGESSRSTQKGLPLDSVISMNWPYPLITAVHRRYFQLIDLALEIFFSDGETYLIAFETKEKRELFCGRLFAMDLPNLTVCSDHLLQTLTAWWREGNITNFQYLMQLNTLAGRTFNDLMQYPVFPFVLADYNSVALNLNSFGVYRNLAKPVAIQDVQMESHYLHVYRSLDIDFKRNARSLAASDGMPIIGAYHYGSHYSNSGIVAHYLVRLPPYTQLVLEYQDNSFDLPDRTFHSISTAYRLSTSESTTDFKELIPEFFFLSEFLSNREGLNLGKRQNGQSISDVELPAWCLADPRLFILIHRQALESAYVSAHLHEWIDLIFGYKQTGQAAIDAINVYHPATYHGTLTAAADSDEIRLKALNTMVRTYGQMPRQLFKTPHLPHLIAQNYLSAPNKQKQSPLLCVSGVRWGHYVGSPELPEPSLVLKQRNHGYSNVKPIRLASLADGSCIGFPVKSMPLVLYGFVKKDLWLANVREVERIFVLSWDFGDRIARLRSVFPPDTTAANWTNIIALHSDEVTCYSSCPGLPMLFFGLKTGVILVYRVDFGDEGLKNCTLVRSLYGHSGPVTAIDVCPEYSVLVTGSETGECFVWDYNKLNFVLALRRHTDGPVTHVCISKTTCEVATVALKGWGSELVLHTINGDAIGSIETDIVITSVAMSAAPEGTAMNCVAAGMQNGLIRLWNMWTLAPMREICHPHFLEPIISLTYSHNSLKLYACTRSGAVLCWDSGAMKQVRPPRFFCLNVH